VVFLPPFVFRFSRIIAIVLLFLAAVVSANGAEAPLRSIREIRGLSLEAIQQGVSASIEATVEVYDAVGGDPLYQVLYLHDGESGIYANCHRAALRLKAGQRVRAEGKVGGGLFAPELLDPVITLLDGAGELLPTRPSYDELMSGVDDCQWIEVEGIVRAVEKRAGRLSVQLSLGGSHFPVAVAGESGVSAKAMELIDSAVRVRGACRTFFNHQRQVIVVGMYTTGFEAFQIQEKPVSPEAMSASRVSDLMTYGSNGRPGHRSKVHGVVTCEVPGSMLFLMDGERGLMVRTNGRAPVRLGDLLEVLGFPVPGVTTPSIEDCSYRVLQHSDPLPPRAISANEASSGKCEAHLVSMDARLLADTCEGKQRVMWLQAGATLFQAIQPLDHPEQFVPCASRSEVRISGICLAHGPLQYQNDVGWTAPSFEILMPASSEPRILHAPPWWTPPRTYGLLGLVAVCLLGTIAWVRALRKQVRQQTEHIRHRVEEQAVLQERNRIARELHDTLAQGFAATAFQLEALGDELDGASDRARRYLSMALTTVRHSLAEARRSVAGLRSETLGLRDLPFALREAGDLLVANTGIQFEFRSTGAVKTLPPACESNLLRIGQEATANAVRHAVAKRIVMTLSYLEDCIELRVIDDGKGFCRTENGVSGHFGLRGMEERAQEIGAGMRIESTAGVGTTLTVTLPLKGSVVGPQVMPEAKQSTPLSPP